MNRQLKRAAAGGIILLAAWIALSASGTAAAVTPDANAHRLALDRGTAGLWQTLLKLHTRASLIQFTAHPDDEDGGMLAYESRFAGVESTLFTLNRGEGGQNVMSSDFWDELGLVRTQELLAADRYYGVDQYFSRVADFGFTKTKQEALQKWGYDRVLYDSVRVVRMTRPLVVTSVFAGNVSDGHGQHQVAGEMAQEVYKAAADPSVFPDQIRAGLRAWAPLKVYVRLPFATITEKGVYDYATGNWAPARFRNYVNNSWIDEKPSATLQVPDGHYSPVLGLSAIQIGRRGLNQQKSQNGGIAIPSAGPDFSDYHLYASRVPAVSEQNNFFDGIDVSLEGIAMYAPADQAPWVRGRLRTINSLVEGALSKFNVDSPQTIAPLLAQGKLQTEALMRDIGQKQMPGIARYNILHELEEKQKQFNTALAQALGLTIEAVVSPDEHAENAPYYHGGAETFQTAIPGQIFRVNVRVANQGSEPVGIEGVRLVAGSGSAWNMTAEGEKKASLAAGAAQNLRFAVTVPEDAAVTKPYFSRPNFEQPYYDISDPAYLNLPLMPYPLSGRATFIYRGAQIVLDKVVQTVHRISGIGPIENPLMVSPAISVWVSPKAGIVPLTSKSLNITVLIHSYVKGPASGTVSLSLPAGWTSISQQASFSTNQDGDEQNITFQVIPGRVQAKTYSIQASATYQGHSYLSGSTMAGYPGLRPYPYYRQASYRATGVDLRLPSSMRIGYVSGTGDKVPESLGDLGIQPIFLSPEDIATGDLGGFNAIILGGRAYAVRPELKTYNLRLMSYVKNGGTLIVQYNTPEFDHNYGPYPYELSGNPEKVIDEDSKVLLLEPSYPALTWPNNITVHDFDGWVEERGHGFMHTWDKRYSALTETSDPGQAPQRGGLLVAAYGKGFYVYDGFALYRQLPEGVPGAFRILANLISLSSNAGMRKLAAGGAQAAH